MIKNLGDCDWRYWLNQLLPLPLALCAALNQTLLSEELGMLTPAEGETRADANNLAGTKIQNDRIIRQICGTSCQHPALGSILKISTLIETMDN